MKSSMKILASPVLLGLLLAGCDGRDSDTRSEQVVAEQEDFRAPVIEDRDIVSEDPESRAAPGTMPESGTLRDPADGTLYSDTSDPQADPSQPASDTTQSAMATISPMTGESVEGEIRFQDMGMGGVSITGELRGLNPGKHGFHIHENGNCSGPNADSAGDHFTINGQPHGSPDEATDLHHTGDLGNIVVGPDGTANIRMELEQITLEPGPAGIIDRAIIVHSDEDDLTSQPSGNSGDPVGCGVIRNNARAAYSGS